MSDMDEILFGPVQDTKAVSGFVVDTVQKAEWALAKVHRANQDIATWETLAAEYHKKIDAWLERATGDDRDTITRMVGLLEPFGQTQCGGKKRHLDLLGGKIGFRESPDHLEVTDEAAALAYLESAHPECVRVKKEVTKAEVKKLIKAGGELPPGVELVAGEIKFYVNTEETEKRIEGAA